MNTIDIVKLGGINRMYGKQKPATTNDLLKGLTQQEAQQQAADIIKLAHDLENKIHTEFLVAQYGRRFDEKDIGSLIERVLFMMGSGSHNRRAIRKLVLCYFGHNIKSSELMSDMDCSKNTVTDRKKKVYDALDKIGNRALSEIDALLKSKRLVA